MNNDVEHYLEHDFNNPRSRAGFYEVILPEELEGLVYSHDRVEFGDKDAEIVKRGRIRCLIAVVEELP